jgi:hypothetical protein
METVFNVLSVDGEAGANVVDLPEFPTRDELRLVVEPYLSGMAMHHVRVLSPPRSKLSHESLDLFCGETAVLRRLPVNREATRLYRAAHLLFHPDDDPDALPHIAGPAVLFLRRVIPVAGDDAESLPARARRRSRGCRGDGHGSSPAP